MPVSIRRFAGPGKHSAQDEVNWWQIAGKRLRI
jgi:hypothetical protein